MIWEDSLEEEMASHSRILAWKIPWAEEFGGLGNTLQSPGSLTFPLQWYQGMRNTLKALEIAAVKKSVDFHQVQVFLGTLRTLVPG